PAPAAPAEVRARRRGPMGGRFLDGLDHAAAVPGPGLLESDAHAVTRHAAGHEHDVPVSAGHSFTTEGEAVDRQDKGIPTLRPAHGSDTINARPTGVNLACALRVAGSDDGGV